MATQEERLSTLEQTFTVLKDDLKDIYYNETMLLGLLTQQQRSIREIKGNLVDLKENMNNRFETQQRLIEAVEQHMNSRLYGLEHRFDTLEQGMNSRFEAQEQRLGGVEQRLDGMEQRLGGVEQRLDGMEQRLGGVEQQLNEHTSLLTQILARLPEKP